MQGHFCFIKCLIFEWLPEVDVSAICWIFDEACSCGPNGMRMLFIVMHNLICDLASRQYTVCNVTASAGKDSKW